MMRLVFSTAIVGLALAAWGEWEYSSALRWNPLDEKPIPKMKSASTFDFWSASGRFFIDVQLPMSKQEESATRGLAMNSQVSCNFVCDLYAGNARISTINVNTLRQYGAFFYGHVDCFDGGTITIPRAGHYLLKVQNLGSDFGMASGRLSLIRRENTENAAVLSGVFRLLIWFFVGMILLIGIWNGNKYWRHRVQSTLNAQ
jgi:hypothetical protein